MLTSVCCGSLAGSFICVQILDEVFGENLIIWVVFIFSLLSLYLTLHLKLIIPLLAMLRTGIVPLSPVLYQKAFSKRLFPSSVCFRLQGSVLTCLFMTGESHEVSARPATFLKVEKLLPFNSYSTVSSSGFISNLF